MNYKKVTSVILCTVLLGGSAAFAAPRDIQKHWAGPYINTLLEHSVVSGYPDGSFGPDQKISREEVASMVAKFMVKTNTDALPEKKTEEEPPSESTLTERLAEESDAEESATAETTGIANLEDATANSSLSTIVFKDVKGRWSESAIELLTRHKLLSGYPDGTFQPTKKITREEFATIVYLYMNQNKRIDTEKTKSFSDINKSYAKNAISVLAGNEILSGYPDKKFLPTNQISRAEVATVIAKISNWKLIPPPVDPVKKVVLDVPYISQVYPVYAPVGCEATSLLMGLKYKGYASNISLKKFLDELPRHSSNPAKGFVGSPYVADATKKTRTTIYPAKLAEYGRKYGNVVDISGASPKQIQEEIMDGNPVVAYVTLWWETPFYRNYLIEGKSQRLLSNNHALLVCGYDPDTNRYYVADPYNVKDKKNTYKYWVKGDVFERLYKERHHAVVIR